MRIFGIDPGSIRTGYGCVETDGTPASPGDVRRASRRPAGAALPERLQRIHDGLARLIARSRARVRRDRKPVSRARTCGARSCSATRAASPCSPPSRPALPVVEYTPAEIKLAVVGYGRAEKAQVQQMVKLLLGLDTAPSPHDAADALAVAICHAHAAGRRAARPRAARAPRHLRSWRHVKLRRARQAPGAVIAHLSGTLLEKHVQRLVVDVGGVGYDVQVPLSTFYARRRAGRARRAAHPHARARGRAAALRVRHGARARAVRAADRASAASARRSRWRCCRASSRPSSCARSASRDVARLTQIPASARRPPSGSCSS